MKQVPLTQGKMEPLPFTRPSIISKSHTYLALEVILRTPTRCIKKYVEYTKGRFVPACGMYYNVIAN